MRVRRFFKGIVVLIVVLVVLFLIFIYSGVYNVAANYRDRPVVEWVLSTISDNSVRHHAAGIKAPALDDPAMIEAGFRYYRDLCVGCHGAPGVKIEPAARAMNPDPPELTEAAKDWKPSELFWITRNGVRMTGMPAWGKVHSDKQIWEIVAFVHRLPSMSPAQYKAMVSKAPPIK